jgi:hypothetical protein
VTISNLDINTYGNTRAHLKTWAELRKEIRVSSKGRVTEKSDTFTRRSTGRITKKPGNSKSRR